VSPEHQPKQLENVMADGNTLHIVNYFTSDMTVSVSDQDWNCCDSPERGYNVGSVPALTKKDLYFIRKDGHGCNGRQGQFALAVTVGGRSFIQPFDFDANGGIEVSNAVPGISVYLKQIQGGTFDLALCPDV
jgi:hypothetical protein